MPAHLRTQVAAVRALFFAALLGALLVTLLMGVMGRGYSPAQAAPVAAEDAFCDMVTQITTSECLALEAFYVATVGDNWITNTGWLQSLTPCNDWYGVVCVGSNVRAIELASNNVSGTLPTELGDLQLLGKLDLRFNNLSGPLPVEIGSMGSLYGLMLSGNQMSGVLTHIAWDDLEKMVDLRFDGNQFTGTIPADFGELVALDKLLLDGNNLSGPIPASFGSFCVAGIGGMCQLTWLVISGEGITGTIPSSLGNLTKLDWLGIGRTSITGSLPESLANLTNIRYLDVTSNRQLGGTIPNLAPLPKLQHLWLSGNALTGTIPVALRANISTTSIRLYNNLLRGPLPTDVVCLPRLTEFNAGANLLTVEDDAAAECLTRLNGEVGIGDQTVPPTGFRTETVTDERVTLVWSPIHRGGLHGYYQIALTQAPDEIPDFSFRTADKWTDIFTIDDLTPGTDYYAHIRTFTVGNIEQPDLYSDIASPAVKFRTLGPPPVLVFSKEVTPTQAAPGDVVTFTLTLHASASTPVDFTDPLPSGVAFERFTRGSAEVISNVVRYSGNLAANVDEVIAYRAMIPEEAAPGSILYSAAKAERGGEESYSASASVAVEAPDPVDTLVLIYAAGDNNLAKHMRDLFQKAEAAKKPDGMEVLLLLDDSGKDGAFYYRLKNDSNRAENCPTAVDRTCAGRYAPGVDMWRWDESVGTYTSLKEFVTGAMQAYSATTVILTLVGHGSGWSPNVLLDQPSTHDEKPDNRFFGGVLWDQEPEAALSTAQLALALQESVAETGQRIDLLYLDACLMAMFEVAYELEGAVDFLLASESVSWTSFRYDLHLDWDSAPSDPVVIGKQWIANEQSELDGASGVEYPYTYSLLDLRGGNLGEVLQLQNDLAHALLAGMQGVDGEAVRSAVLAAAEQTACFDSNQDRKIDGVDSYCDLFSFAAALVDAFGVTAQAEAEREAIYAAAVALQTFLDPASGQFTLYERNNPAKHPRGAEDDPAWAWSQLGGISVYLPLRADDWKRRYYSPAYLRAAADGYWDEFVGSYYAAAEPPSDPEPCTTRCSENIVGPESLFSQVWLPMLASE